MNGASQVKSNSSNGVGHKNIKLQISNLKPTSYLRRNFPHMNLHEFQAKELLKKYNVPVQEGIACGTVHEAEEAYRQIKTQFGSPFAVVKAQIHAGGRGKGTIKETGINGVKVGKGLDEVVDYAQNLGAR
jgi:hypothetical protein